MAVALLWAPASADTSGYSAMMAALAKIGAWVVGPSMVLTVISGLLAIAVNPAYQDAGWVWAKAASGILILEGGLHVIGPIQDEAKRAAGTLAGSPDTVGVASLLTAEANTLWVLLAVAVANVALAIWRPRFPRIPF